MIFPNCSLANLSFSSTYNYTANAKSTNVDFTSSLDSSKTWNKKGELKYITIEEQNISTGENTYDYLEINSLPTLPSDASTKTYTLKVINGVLTWVEG